MLAVAILEIGGMSLMNSKVGVMSKSGVKVIHMDGINGTAII